jgi:bacteriocin-like protein
MTNERIENATEVMTDEELAAVVGGMTCGAAGIVAAVYMGLGDMWLAMGSPAQASGYYGRANGVVQGACS